MVENSGVSSVHLWVDTTRPKTGVSGHRGHQWIVAYDIYRLQSAHTASPVCTAIKTTSIASNYAFHFHRALKFRLCIFNCSMLPAGASPLDPLGTSFPQTPICPPTSPSRSAPDPNPTYTTGLIFSQAIHTKMRCRNYI